MNDVRGYRYGIPVIAVAAICSLAAVLIGSASQSTTGIFPQCLGQDVFSDGFNFIDLFWSCSDGYRLSLMAFMATMSVLAISGAGFSLANRRSSASPNLSRSLRIVLAGSTVGVLYLLGLYIYEFLYHHGYYNQERPLSPAFVAGMPVLISLMHFPNRWGFLMAIPVFALGFVSLVLIAWVTGIPLD